MSHVRTVPANSDGAVTVTGPLVHLCPHVDEVDDGRVTITWRTQGETYELHSLAEYLRSFKGTKVSHEEITDRIRYELSVVPRIELLSVESHWRTAGLEVSCTSSPTPVAQP